MCHHQVLSVLRYACVEAFLTRPGEAECRAANFHIFGPDETFPDGLEAVFEVTNRPWKAAMLENDEFLAPSGHVMEMLSGHAKVG